MALEPQQQEGMRQAAQNVTSRAPAANLNTSGAAPPNSPEWQNLQRQAANSDRSVEERQRDLQRAYEAGQQNYREQIRKQEADARRKKTPFGRASSKRRKASIRNWSAESRSRRNKGRANIDYVRHYSEAAKQAQAEKTELMDQHEAILKQVSETGEITPAQKAILDSAAAKWSMLGDKENDATGRLGGMGTLYKEIANANWQRIQTYEQRIDQIMQRQGAGLFSIMATAMGHGFVAYMKYDHRRNYGWSGVGTEPISPSERRAIIKATTEGLGRGHQMGLTHS